MNIIYRWVFYNDISKGTHELTSLKIWIKLSFCKHFWDKLASKCRSHIRFREKFLELNNVRLPMKRMCILNLLWFLYYIIDSVWKLNGKWDEVMNAEQNRFCSSFSWKYHCVLILNRIFVTIESRSITSIARINHYVTSHSIKCCTSSLSIFGFLLNRLHFNCEFSNHFHRVNIFRIVYCVSASIHSNVWQITICLISSVWFEFAWWKV